MMGAIIEVCGEYIEWGHEEGSEYYHLKDGTIEEAIIRGDETWVAP